MKVADQLKIIDNKIEANQAQYNLDRLAAKISAYSSGDLKKYEYLTGENLGYKPSVFEQAKFDYSPLGNIFGLDKERLFKRIENFKDKNKELLKAFGAANKVSKAAKNKSDFSYGSRYASYNFYRVFEKFKRMSLGFKYDEINYFYLLLNAFINIHKATTTKPKNCKNKIMNNVNQLYNYYFNVYKDPEKPSWFEINRKEFEELTRDTYSNQDNNNLKIIINKRTYELKMQKDFGWK